MYTVLMTIHVVACLGMILFVLLQTGRGAGLQMFGGGGDSLINTPSGSSFMKKFTAGLAATFAFTSLFLTLLHDRGGMSSVTSSVDGRGRPPAMVVNRGPPRRRRPPISLGDTAPSASSSDQSTAPSTRPTSPALSSRWNFCDSRSCSSLAGSGSRRSVSGSTNAYLFSSIV